MAARLGDQIAGFDGVKVIGNAEALALANASSVNHKVESIDRQQRMQAKLRAELDRRALDAWFNEEDDGGS